jgi:hypothetical protein
MLEEEAEIAGSGFMLSEDKGLFEREGDPE